MARLQEHFVMHDILWVGLFLILLIGSVAYAKLVDRA